MRRVDDITPSAPELRVECCGHDVTVMKGTGSRTDDNALSRAWPEMLCAITHEEHEKAGCAPLFCQRKAAGQARSNRNILLYRGEKGRRQDFMFFFLRSRVRKMPWYETLGMLTTWNPYETRWSLRPCFFCTRSGLITVPMLSVG